MTFDTAPAGLTAALDDCWNAIGVHGDFSCPELQRHVHCRNCPVYSAAAVDMLDAAAPAGYLDDWTREVAREKPATEPGTRSVLLFRIAAEWFALPTSVLQEIAGLRPIHSIPHRRDGVLLGLVNIRGELLICISLQHILALGEPEEHSPERHSIVGRRLLVIQRDGTRVVWPVDEVYGIQRFHPRDLASVPATIAGAAATYTQAVLAWNGRVVGVLDDQLLFHTVNRSVA